MKVNHREMNYNKVINSKFSYLKYSDNSDEQTMLFFLSPDSVCKSVRIICDVRLRSQKIKELNSHYLKNGENQWIDRRDRKEYLIGITQDKWSCVISIESKK